MTRQRRRMPQKRGSLEWRFFSLYDTNGTDHQFASRLYFLHPILVPPPPPLDRETSTIRPTPEIKETAQKPGMGKWIRRHPLTCRDITCAFCLFRCLETSRCVCTWFQDTTEHGRRPCSGRRVRVVSPLDPTSHLTFPSSNTLNTFWQSSYNGV
jgi:hypothetical protein